MEIEENMELAKSECGMIIKDTQYEQDIKNASDLLSYRKVEVIRYLNRKVPFVIFPYKYMKIEDMSFTVAENGELFIHLYLNDGMVKNISSQNGNPVLYDFPGTITVGPGVEYAKTFLRKTENVLKQYIAVLERIQVMYPGENIYFGKNNEEFVSRIIDFNTLHLRK